MAAYSARHDVVFVLVKNLAADLIQMSCDAFSQGGCHPIAQLDAIEAVSAGTTVVTADKIYILDDSDGVMKPVLIATVLQYIVDAVWAKSAETSPDTADLLLLLDGSTEKTVTLAKLAALMLATNEGALLNFSDMTDGASTIATTDYMCVTQTTTGKRIQISDLSTLIYASLAAHVIALSGTVTAGATDLFYFLQGGTVAKKMTLAELAVYVNSVAGLTGSGTADYLAKWSGATALAAGYSVLASGGDMGAGADTEIATTKAVREELDDLITDGVVCEIFVPASVMYAPTTLPAPAGTSEYGATTLFLKYFAFDGGGNEERCQFVMKMPPGWDLGTIRAKFHWDSSAGSTPGDTVEMAIQALALGSDDAIDTAFGTAQVISDTLLAQGDMHVTGATPAMTVDGSPARDDMVAFQVTRNTDGTDDMSEDVWLFGVSLQYTADKVVAAWS